MRLAAGAGWRHCPVGAGLSECGRARRAGRLVGGAALQPPASDREQRSLRRPQEPSRRRLSANSRRTRGYPVNPAASPIDPVKFIRACWRAPLWRPRGSCADSLETRGGRRAGTERPVRPVRLRQSRTGPSARESRWRPEFPPVWSRSSSADVARRVDVQGRFESRGPRLPVPPAARIRRRRRAAAGCGAKRRATGTFPTPWQFGPRCRAAAGRGAATRSPGRGGGGTATFAETGARARRSP